VSKYIVVFGGITAGNKRVGFPGHLVAKKDGKAVLTPAFHALPEGERLKLEEAATIELSDAEAKRMDPTGLCLMPLSDWKAESAATAAAAKARAEVKAAEASKKGGK
jgi:hypothetical protein